MNKKKAKLKYKNNTFDIIEEGDFVVCAISGKQIFWKILVIGMLIYRKLIFHL